MSTKTIRQGTVTRKRKSRLPWLAWLFVILAIIIWWALYQSRWFLVEHIKVSGAHRVPATKVSQIAHINLGKPLMSVDPGAVVQALKGVPQIKDARVERGWPHTVLITIVERAPVAYVLTKSGFNLVDEEGMPAGQVKVKPRKMWLVVAKPHSPAMKAAAQVAMGLPTQWKYGSVSAKSPEAVIVTLPSGAQINFGSSEQLGIKVKVAKALLANKFSQINVSSPMNPTVK